MKKLLLLLVVVFFSCNFGEINIVGHKKHKDKLPDLTIVVKDYILFENAIELQFHIENRGGLKFSQTNTVIITYIDDNTEIELLEINNLDTSTNFYITQIIPFRSRPRIICTTIDKPIIDGIVSFKGFILESNEHNKSYI